MGATVFGPTTVPESGHPAGHEGYLCAGQVVSGLDHAALESGAWEGQHAWDYETNLTRIVVDHDAKTITFEVKGG